MKKFFNKRILLAAIMICTLFDPRFLKENKDFDMDYNAKLIVCAEKTEKTEYEGEMILKVNTKKIFIL